jgi:hypothetical protein
MTLGDVGAEFAGLAIEGFIDDESLKKVEEKFGLKPSKKVLSMYLAEACATGEPKWLSDGAVARLKSVLSGASRRFI